MTMRQLSLLRPSPALVIACGALAVALGGTGYATVLQVPRNSVGTAQLKTSAVTSGKLASNAVTSAKVRNRSLLRVDFAPGQLAAGPTGPAGPAGAAGPAGPPGLSAVERVETTSVMNSTPSRTAFVACPAGKRLLGGGARLNPTLPQVALQTSFPDNDNVYRAAAREVNATGSTWSLTVFAICGTTS
jgi:hypothetical protein